MAGPQEARPSKFENGYYENNIKTLGDLFNYEKKLVEDIANYKKELEIKDLSKTRKAELAKYIKDAEKQYDNLYASIDKLAEKNVKKQEENRRRARIKEFKEYEALLKQQVTAGITSEKNKNKQLKSLQQALDREAAARDAKDAARGKQERRRSREDLLEASKLQLGGAGGWGNWREQMAASFEKVGENIGKKIGKAFQDISNKINSAMDTYSKYQSTIDTRLQESGKTFEQMQSSLKSAVGASPYLKTETMLSNLQTLVEAGIVTNIEQRAFLNTIKDKVAATFDAANSSLLRIIRLQQNDSTAARLGMEAYLTRFLNVMVENTEYLTSTFDNVQSALLEASSIMDTATSTEFEYVVQKWLGTLVGRGMSESTATSIAGAIGMLGSGNISGLAGSSLNNLLVMASSRAGLNYADLITGGLNASNTNRLMSALVQYMQEINASGNNAVRSQYAQTFGLSISDLMAATGVGNIGAISNNFLSYSGMYDELSDQLGKVGSRTHISEAINNLFENAQFSLASNIAGNAVTAAMWKVTDMIQGVTGGINIPAISVLGNMVDLETTVENLMKIGIVGVGSLGMIGDVVTGLGQFGSGLSGTLRALNINANSANFSGKTVGAGLASRARGLTTSSTTSLVSNSAGSDIKSQTLGAAMDEANTDLADAQETTDNPSADIRDYMLGAFKTQFTNLLEIVALSNGYAAEENPITLGNESVVATYKLAEGEENKNVIESVATISTNVARIYEKLSEGISVEVSNFPLSGYGGITQNSGI